VIFGDESVVMCQMWVTVVH